MKLFKPQKQLFSIAAVVMLTSIFGCKKSSGSESDPGYGCNSQVILKTLTNANGQLSYVPGQSQWAVSFSLPGGYLFACDFCDQSAISSIVAGHSTGDVINVTISGEVKRRVENQPDIVPTTGYTEIYLISVSSVN